MFFHFFVVNFRLFETLGAVFNLAVHLGTAGVFTVLKSTILAKKQSFLLTRLNKQCACCINFPSG